ncbi:MAG: CAP domain-containing protein, partial [Chloroflexota bacterium]
KRLLIILGSILVVGILSACGQTEETVSLGQPAISVSQRQGSMLTATTEGDQAAVENQPEDPTAENIIPPNGTLPPAENPPDQAAITPSPSEAVQISPTTTSAGPEFTNTSIPVNSNPPTAESNTATPTEQSEDESPAVCDPGASSAFEAEVIVLINAERAKVGIDALSIQSQLTTAARNHSDDMTCSSFFSHESPTSGSPFDRIEAAGYSYSWAGENIAAGYGTPAALVEGWMSSEGHRANILNANFTQVGIGYAYWAESEYGAYWTAVFASP